jgi:hypothetical protein
MASIAQVERHVAMERWKWTGIADKVAAVRVALPARFSKFPFQFGIRLATASISGISSTLLSLRMDSGIPRYLHGKEPTWHCRMDWMSAVCTSEQ